MRQHDALPGASAVSNAALEERLVWPRAVLFDWDSTLVDNWGSIELAINAALAAMGMPTWTTEEVHARVRGSLRDTFPRLFGERWQEARRVFYEAFEAGHLETLRPLPGAGDLLDRLAMAGVPLAVVSNKTGTYLRKEVAHLGWTPRFRAVVGAQDAVEDKPSAAPVHLALDGSGIEPGPDVWFVGDTEIDVACARRSGCTSILVCSSALVGPAFADLAPDVHLTDCVALLGRIPPG